MSEPRPVRMPERMFCRRHLLEVVPERHPTGVLWQTRYTVAGVELFRIVVADPRIVEKCGGDASMLSAIIAQHVPLCCFVGPAQLAAVREEVELAARRVAARLPRAEGA